MSEIIYPEESYKIMGACFEVYKEKGCGFLEAVFQECLELELADQQVPFVPKPLLALSYKGRPLKQTYSPDLVCYGKIIVELKAVSALADRASSASAQLSPSNRASTWSAREFWPFSQAPV